MKVDREEKKKAVTLKECKKESLNLLSRSLSFYNSLSLNFIDPSPHPMCSGGDPSVRAADACDPACGRSAFVGRVT